MLIPAITPVRAGKNTPNTLNQLWCSVYDGLLLFLQTVIFHPWNPLSKNHLNMYFKNQFLDHNFLFSNTVLHKMLKIPGSVWENDPIPKSAAPRSRTTKSANWSLTTHWNKKRTSFFLLVHYWQNKVENKNKEYRSSIKYSTFTPAKLIKVRKMMTAAATILSIHGDPSFSPAITPAMDSPNPVAQRAFPIA